MAESNESTDRRELLHLHKVLISRHASGGSEKKITSRYLDDILRDSALRQMFMNMIAKERRPYYEVGIMFKQ